MTLFWIVFLLGFTYLVALVGNIYEAINPWRAIASLVGLRKWPGRIPYPEGLAYWPAFAFYLGLIWLELMVLPRPLVLSQVLFAYTIVTLAAAWLFGTAAWFRHGEVFAVLLRLVGTLAPVAYERGPGGEWRGRLRLPLSGTVEDRPEHVSLVLFVLFMLSSTTYDGLHETTLWVGLYWTNLLALFEPVWGSDMAKAQAILAPGYALFQNLGLLISPFAYFAIYLAVIAAVKWATGSRATHLAIARDFAFSVIPIAFVYNVAHYFTALLGVWPTLPYLASDPFGFGWNLLRLPPPSEPAPLDMAAIWHSELALILAGHVASVFVAHLIALRVFPTRLKAWTSEIPLLLLMVAYTFFGLFVLSLPLAIH